MITSVRRIVSVTCAFAAAASFVGQAHLLAGQQVPPAVSVVAFDGQGTSQKDREAMADELAARLVDTRRFRVMPREWLPADRENPDPTMAALFESAKAAQIDYLIFGTTRQHSTPLRSGPPPLLVAALAMRARLGPAALLFPALSASTQRVQTVLTVHVRVVDVATTDEVRTVNASRSTRALTPILASSPKPKLNRDWMKAIAEIASTLDVRRSSEPIPALHR